MHTISQRQGDGLLTRAALAARSVGELLAALTWRAAMHVVTWQGRARERRKLATLDDHLLRDMGMSRSQIDLETRKSFWEA